jgi:hypothetical protein
MSLSPLVDKAHNAEIWPDHELQLFLYWFRLEGKELSFDGFAIGIDRNAGEGLKDYCTLYRARAYTVRLPRATVADITTAVGMQQLLGQGQSANGNCDAAVSGNHVEAGSSEKGLESSNRGGAEAGGNDNDDGEDGEEEDDDESAVSETLPYTSTDVAMCVELVGSRFLRQMVRIMVVREHWSEIVITLPLITFCDDAYTDLFFCLFAYLLFQSTAARESILPEGIRNENIMLDICATRDRSRASSALPGRALCFAGVGYDARDLAIYKFMPKVQLQALLLEFEREDKLKLQREQQQQKPDQGK